ncbi:hypothetical protein KO561_14505 [Radiobacillus kanasensis]|uniref:hypothetical protein n=1 Tax=Radiobacillus kanasensis TaxID=2844358 RepID=UPI001E64DEAF|nr:hypothetical protein [Radiobacillus kanasensis]UFT98403.1 hypothetical protein KO561_14505 [Radiobacillus kanasensis]
MLKLDELNKAMDYKKAMITHLFDLKKQLDLGENPIQDIVNQVGKLVIHTHSATIEGDINLFDSEEDEKTFIDFGLDDFGKEMKGLPSEFIASNITGPIHIKDAIIKPLSNPEKIQKVSEMLVFSDQIVGVSISKG